MIVAVTMRMLAHTTYVELRDAISHDWTRKLEGLGVTPVFVPNVLRDPVDYVRRIGAAGIILTGGESFSCGAAGMPMGTARDRSEALLVGYARRERVPLFGVCRGLQLINVLSGGTVSDDLAKGASHVNVMHPVRIVDAPTNGRGAVADIETNSFHERAVFLRDLAPDLKPFALAAGDVVEGLYHADLPVIAVQWHPERHNPAADFDDRLLQGWLAQCE